MRPGCHRKVVAFDKAWEAASVEAASVAAAWDATQPFGESLGLALNAAGPSCGRWRAPAWKRLPLPRLWPLAAVGLLGAVSASVLSKWWRAGASGRRWKGQFLPLSRHRSGGKPSKPSWRAALFRKR